MSRARFIALPVGVGDAFILEREDEGIVVVDGGKRVKELPKLFVKYRQHHRANVLICTHNDADHANGIRGLLEDRTFVASEVWLPVEFCESLIASKRLGVDKTITILRAGLAGDNLPVDKEESARDLIDDRGPQAIPRSIADHAAALSRRLRPLLAWAPSIRGTPAFKALGRLGALTPQRALKAMENVARSSLHSRHSSCVAALRR